MLGANQPAIEGTLLDATAESEMSEEEEEAGGKGGEGFWRSKTEDREKELAKVKAMTMHEMIETIEPVNGGEEILFLTGARRK